MTFNFYAPRLTLAIILALTLAFNFSACRSSNADSLNETSSTRDATLPSLASPDTEQQRQAAGQEILSPEVRAALDELPKAKGRLRAGFSIDAPLSVTHAAQTLALNINAILADQRRTQHAGRWGVCVRSAKDGRVLFRHNAGELFAPASNMKVYTTAAALELLGAEYRWRTSVYASNDIDANGTLNGDLILYGRGAPDLSSTQQLNQQSANNSLNALAQMLHTKGLRAVRGRVIADASYFGGETHPQGWLWDDMHWYYGAEASAMTINDNSLLLTVGSVDKQPGEAPDVRTIPANFQVQLQNDAVVVARGRRPTIGVTRGGDDGTLRVYGELPAGTQSFGVRVSANNPALAAAVFFREALARNNINAEAAQTVARDSRSRREGVSSTADTSKINEASATMAQDSAIDASLASRELAFTSSRTLGEIVRTTNKESDNLKAELLLRTLGRTRGTPSSAARAPQTGVRGVDDTNLGALLLRGWLQQIGVQNVEAFSLHDGSGLSPLDLVTPEATVQLLAYMTQTASAQIFFDSLPRAGYDGTLRGRLGDTGGRVHAKTGALAQTNALSGYAFSADDEPLIFSIFCNEASGATRVSPTIDRIVRLLTEYSETNVRPMTNTNGISRENSKSNEN